MEFLGDLWKFMKERKKFWLAPISLARNNGIDPKTVRRIEKLVFEHYALLKEKYNDVHRS